MLTRKTITYRELAEELNLHESTMRYKIRNMEKAGVIMGYRGRIDYRKANLTGSITGIDVDSEKIWDVLDWLKSREEVIGLYLTTGDHILIAEIVCDSKEEAENLHKEINELPGVRKVCPAIITDIYK